MPSANVVQLRAELDAFARTRLTAADFDPVLDVEAELDLDEITPGLFQALRLLEPYGTGNHEPAFSARAVRLIAPPKILKDKHIKLKLKAGEVNAGHEFSPESSGEDELSAVAVLTTPSCHPDGAAIRREEKAEAKGFQLRTENREPRTGARTVFDALGWHMAERLQQSPLLAGDAIDIAFTIGHNDHPDFGGLELTLRDFKIPVAAVEPESH
jgi:single-stranded-DNA-specific exonuclease